MSGYINQSDNVYCSFAIILPCRIDLSENSEHVRKIAIQKSVFYSFFFKVDTCTLAAVSIEIL